MPTIKTKGWSARLRRTNDRHSSITVVGTALVPKASLKYAVPQGINPAILMLELKVESDARHAQDVTVETKVEYRNEGEVLPAYTDVQILYAGQTLVIIDVEDEGSKSADSPTGGEVPFPEKLAFVPGPIARGTGTSLQTAFDNAVKQLSSFSTTIADGYVVYSIVETGQFRGGIAGHSAYYAKVQARSSASGE